MPIEEMIKFLQGCAEVGQPEFSHIEAVLELAQAMRKELSIINHYKRDGSMWFSEVITIDSIKLASLIQTWDATTTSSEKV